MLLKNSGHKLGPPSQLGLELEPISYLTSGLWSALVLGRSLNVGLTQNKVLNLLLYAVSFCNPTQTPAFKCHLFVHNSQVYISSLPTPVSTKFVYVAANLTSIV